jgi:hypothetical protein
VQKRWLPAIPEEDEATATRHPKVEVPGSPEIITSPGGSPPQEDVQLDNDDIKIFLRELTNDLEKFLNSSI